jgi:hypothetical protein
MPSFANVGIALAAELNEPILETGEPQEPQEPQETEEESMYLSLLLCSYLVSQF